MKRAPRPTPPLSAPDAPALGLDQALADGQAQPAAEAARPVPGGAVFTEQLAELVRRDATALVGDRDRHIQPLALRRDPDGGGLGRVARGVGEQVVEHLHQALPVGHDSRQVGRQVDADGVPPAAADERAARLVHQHGDIRRLGPDRQRAGVDAPGVEQVADQAVHAVGLLVDDAEELRHLGRADEARGAQRRGGALLHDSTAARVGALFQLLVQDTTAQDFGLPSSAIRLRM